MDFAKPVIDDPELRDEVLTLEADIERLWRGLSEDRRRQLWSESGARRWQASNEHRRDAEAFRRWREADEWIRRERPPLELDTLCAINQKVLGLEAPAQLRTEPSENRFIQFAPPQEIRSATEKVLAICRAGPPGLLEAAHLVQSLLTIHPFRDGNGRSLRLVLDLYLFTHDLPPPLYERPMDLLIANSYLGPQQYSFDHAVILVGTAVERSLDLLKAV